MHAIDVTLVQSMLTLILVLVGLSMIVAGSTGPRFLLQLFLAASGLILRVFAIPLLILAILAVGLAVFNSKGGPDSTVFHPEPTRRTSPSEEEPRNGD